MGITHKSDRIDARPGSIASFDVADFPVPHGREENWRFTPLARLRGLHDGTAQPGGKVAVDIDAPDGVVVETVDRDDPRIGRTGAPVDRVAAAAWSSFAEATVITVPSESVLDRPVWVTRRGESADVASFAHVVIDIAPFATAVVVLDHAGSATLADNVEIVVGESANLTLVSLQDWSRDSVHVSQHRALVGRDARLKAVHVSLGGDLVRIAPSVAYAGPGGDAELWGLFFADEGQHLEHRLFVDHEAPHCRSRVTYKGALQGKNAHTVWIGDVLIRAKAVGTDTYELNRNLVLTDGARADSVPNLEIETGEVTGAGHASATGRFDDEQLFYLQARGIPADEARRLVVRGFFHEVLQQIGIDELEARLVAKVEQELEGHGV
ncbi:Fe-S cluster assembly protein SufD [Nocardioides sp.]|uniref:Fe-S cluster assembly protein SufD n=1 Tax=Nocardioides sp. TaxID=35761 RepID=UPI00286E20AF|nr:Fe-S cluster assembly protein SufD [Nocardioides sp.]